MSYDGYEYYEPYDPYEADYEYRAGFNDANVEYDNDFDDPDWEWIGPPDSVDKVVDGVVDEAIDQMFNFIHRIERIGAIYMPTSYIVKDILFDAEFGQDIPF